MNSSMTNSPSRPQAYKALALKLLQDQWTTLRWRPLAVAAVLVGVGLSALLPAQFYRIATTSLLHTPSPREALIWVLGFGAAVAAVQLVATLAATVLGEWVRFQVETDLRRKVFSRMYQAPLTSMDGPRRSQWLGRITEDLERTEAFLARTVPEYLRQFAIALGVAVLLLHHSGALALIPLAGLALALAGQSYWQRRRTRLRQRLESLHADGARMLRENLEGMRTIRSQGVEAFLQRRFENHLSDVSQRGLRLSKGLGLTLGSGDLAVQLLITLSLGAAAWAVASGALSVTDALIYPFFLGLFFTSTRKLGRLRSDWNRFVTDAGRLGELLFGNVLFPFSVSSVASETSFESARALRLHDLEITVGGRPLAGPVSLTVPRGEIWAVMGPNGCGKSTFLEVLAGLRPGCGGAALTDASGGVLWEGHGEELMLPVGPAAYVEKTPYLFEGTLRDNLTFGNPHRLSDAVIWQFLERAGLYHYVRGHGGLDRMLTNRGRDLSQGERYRLALCRALLLKRPFLLLDEPFTGLDELSLELVMGTLEFQKNLAGIVIVTHYIPRDFPVDGVISFEHSSQENAGTEAEAEIAGVPGTLTV